MYHVGYGLAVVGYQCVDVDETGDLRVVARFGDDHAAVGVADEEDGTVHQCDGAVGSCDVVFKGGERVLDGYDVVAFFVEKGNDAGPTGAVGEGAVYEDDVL